MTETLRRWLRHANERLAGSEVRILTAPGNDDPWLVDDDPAYSDSLDRIERAVRAYLEGLGAAGPSRP